MKNELLAYSHNIADRWKNYLGNYWTFTQQIAQYSYCQSLSPRIKFRAKYRGINLIPAELLKAEHCTLEIDKLYFK